MAAHPRGRCFRDIRTFTEKRRALEKIRKIMKGSESVHHPGNDPVQNRERGILNDRSRGLAREVPVKVPLQLTVLNIARLVMAITCVCKRLA